MMRHRTEFTVAVLLLLLAASAAQAVVMPEREWFDSPEKYAEWQRMWPVLTDWEFSPQPALTGAARDSFDGIRGHLGQDDGAVAVELGVEAEAPDVYRYDLNMDGRVDHFDVLKLGYEVIPPQKTPSIAPSSGTNQWIVLRADFSNQSADYTTYDIDYFEERFFDEAATKPSANDYYQEVSYGALAINGTIWDGGDYGDGWYKGLHTKSWYITNGGGWLVKEAVEAADDTVDFSDFDVDGDGFVDSCIVFYPNQVYSGGLWPHRSSGLNIHVDGVIVDSYFLTGYDTGNDSKTMVISVHEYGHILGLPDLYDVDYSSNGMGVWSLMSNNYDTQQKVPSPDPWCKIALGWVEPTVITDDVTGYSLSCFQDYPEVLKVWTNGQQEDQYFLVANYRKKKTDANRPGEGLLVLHIDDSVGGGDQDNKNENHKHVDVESARGYNDPELTNPKDPIDAKQDSGKANDLWFSGNSDSSYTGVFDDDSNPFARDYPNPGDDTFIALSSISAAGDTMTLDIDVVTDDAPTCAITSHSDGDDVTGTITVEADATPGTDRSIDHVEFYLNGAYYGADASSPYSLDIDTRGVYDGDGRELKAIAVDDLDQIDTDTVSVDVSNDAVAIPWSDDYESGIGAWASYDLMGYRRWESSSTAYEGSQAAGIGSTTSGYDYDENDWLVSVRFDLTAATHPIARWRQRYRVAGGENSCKVLVSDDGGDTYTTLKTYTGSNLDWHPQAVDLVDYVGDEVYLAFQLDGSSLNRVSTEGGWWLDMFEIHEQSGAPTITNITPGSGSTLTGVETITVTATDDEGVLAVEFIIDGDDLIHTDYTDPFSYDWNSDWVFNGSHTFRAIAYDADLLTDDLTVNWTTDNDGVDVPFSEYFNSDPGTVWRTINDNGLGEWHWLSDAGYSGGGMRFSIPGYSEYDNMDNDYYISPTLNISGTDPGVGYIHKYDIEPPPYDYGRVLITTDLENWDELAYYSAYNQGWQAGGARLDDYSGDQVKLAFFFESDGGLTVDGWWLDEVLVKGAPQVTDVSPNKVEVGDTITITGSGFGDGSTGDFPTVKVAGVVASYSSWSDTSITATVPDASSGVVTVTRHGIESDGVSITVRLLPPELQSLEQL